MPRIQVSDQTTLYASAQERIVSLERSNDQALSRMAELVRSSDNGDKRLAQARLNLDIAEASNRTLLREVQEDRVQISRLSGQVAKSVGCEGKLEALRLERDDLVQERDAAENRVKVLETKTTGLTAKCCECFIIILGRFGALGSLIVYCLKFVSLTTGGGQQTNGPVRLTSSVVSTTCIIRRDSTGCAVPS